MSVGVEQETERQIEALKLLIKWCNVSIREMERRLDLGAGSLNRIFAGRIELKVRHIMLILAELGVEPPTFYRLVYGDTRPEQTMAERLFELFGEQPKPRPGPPKTAVLDAEGMERWMRDMFARLVAEQKAEPRTAGKKTPKSHSQKAAKPRYRLSLPLEEKLLGRLYGEAYEAYRRRTHRYFGRQRAANSP